MPQVCGCPGTVSARAVNLPVAAAASSAIWPTVSGVRSRAFFSFFRIAVGIFMRTINSLYKYGVHTSNNTRVVNVQERTRNRTHNEVVPILEPESPSLPKPSSSVRVALMSCAPSRICSAVVLACSLFTCLLAIFFFFLISVRCTRTGTRYSEITLFTDYFQYFFFF